MEETPRSQSDTSVEPTPEQAPESAPESPADSTPEPALAVKPGVNPWVVAIALLLGACFVNFWTLGDSPLARTEGHRALTGHEIVETGNWITPSLYGKVYLRKPPGSYWAVAVAEIVTGTHGTFHNEFVWRLPSALSAVGVVMLMWFMGRRWFGDVGGAAAGFSCLGMIALWSQNRAAEIDAMNTLASVACACAVLECGFGPTKRRWAWGGFAALSMAALLLLKGPAGMPVVGGAIIGGSIATQKWAWAKRPSVWVSLVIGIGIFAAWVLAAALTITTENLNPDDSGPNEVYNRLTPDDIGHLLTAAGMPFTLIGYSMPWSIAVLLGFVPSVTRSMEEFAFRVRARAAMGTVVAAFVICGIALMTRPRYGYVALPMVCLAVAAIAEAWYRGWFSAGLRAMLRQVMTVTVVLLAGLYGVLMYLSVEEGSDRMAWLIGGAVVGGGLLLLGVGAWVMQKHRPGAWAVAGLIVVASIGFNEYKHLDRDARSGLRLGQQLREQIGVDEAIVAEKTVLDHPEVFYYGKLDATRYLGGLEEAFQRKEPAWFIMHKDEWEEWKGKVGTRMINVKPIDDPIADWQIGWYLGEPATLEIQ